MTGASANPTAPLSSHKLGTPGSGALEDGALEDGTLGFEAAEVGATEVGATEVGATEVGATEVGATEVGATQREAFDGDAFDGGAFELGAIWDGEATRFAVHSHAAEAVYLSFFEHPLSGIETRRIPLRRGGDDIWRTELRDAPPGTLYGFRADGPWQPQRGHLFNPAKLLIDPMARAVTGDVRESSANYAFDPRRPSRPEHSYNGTDNASFMPKCIVVDPTFDWQGDRPLRIPWEETVIYEAHVRGLTRLHPQIPERLRGTYLGLCAPPVIEHLQALGITAVELMPVAQIADEPHLAQKALRNYWGYSPLAFCAPNARYACDGDGRQVGEFKTMVREFHRAGMEVLLDVVFNHTAEGGHGGPTLSLRGLDHRTYYRLHPYNGTRHLDVTGCGNTLDVGNAAVRRLILESLRYWVVEMHVDGFRFDLGPVFGREHGSYDRDSALFREIADDAILSQVKLIAEPWDIGPDGYQLGNFPVGWAEWNDRYRDAVRRFWHGDPEMWSAGSAAEFAWRMGGSAELFDQPGRGPLSGIHFIACHDGFTLQDVVSYSAKHNAANQENNCDGHNHNLSCNWGIEGPAADVEIQNRRDLVRRNFITSTILSQGVPMLLHGDELGRTQQGNNNAYCQDGPLTWVHWDLDDGRLEFLAFVRRALAVRRDFGTSGWSSFRHLEEYFAPCGSEITPDAWQSIRAFGTRTASDHLILINGLFEPTVFFSPRHPQEERTVALDTGATHRIDQNLRAPWQVEPFSILVLQSNDPSTPV